MTAQVQVYSKTHNYYNKLLEGKHNIISSPLPYWGHSSAHWKTRMNGRPLCLPPPLSSCSVTEFHHNNKPRLCSSMALNFWPNIKCGEDHTCKSSSSRGLLSIFSECNLFCIHWKLWNKTIWKLWCRRLAHPPKHRIKLTAVRWFGDHLSKRRQRTYKGSYSQSTTTAWLVSMGITNSFRGNLECFHVIKAWMGNWKTLSHHVFKTAPGPAVHPASHTLVPSHLYQGRSV